VQEEGVLVHRFPFGLKFSLPRAGVCDVSCARTFHEPHLPDGANGVVGDVSGAWERPCAEQGTSTLTHEVHVILSSTDHFARLSPLSNSGSRLLLCFLSSASQSNCGGNGRSARGGV